VVCGNHNFGLVSVLKKPNRTEFYLWNRILWLPQCCIKPSMTTIVTKLTFQVSTSLGRRSWLIWKGHSVTHTKKCVYLVGLTGNKCLWSTVKHSCILFHRRASVVLFIETAHHYLICTLHFMHLKENHNLKLTSICLLLPVVWKSPLELAHIGSLGQIRIRTASTRVGVTILVRKR